MGKWVLRVIIIALAAGIIYETARSCQIESKRRHDEAMQQMIKEDVWHHTRDRVLQDIRILKNEIITEQGLLDKIERENRGKRLGSVSNEWWKKFDEHRNRINALYADIERARGMFNVDNAAEVDKLLDETRTALRKYQSGIK